MVPWAGIVVWPKWLVKRPRHGIAGTAPGVLSPRGRAPNGALICWENLFPDLSARLAAEGASAFVQLTNDSDFQGNAEPSQHAVASVLRAIEYGRPVLVASTTGPSLAVDARGRVKSALARDEDGGRWMIASVNTSVEPTVYSRCGLLWVWPIGILATARALATRRRRKHETGGGMRLGGCGDGPV